MRAAEIARLLPAVFRDGEGPDEVLDAILAVMERMHEPAEAALASLDGFLDPRRAPDTFVALLAEWVALGPYLDRRMADGTQRAAIRPAALRDLVAAAAPAARLRGTAEAILALLEAATGVRGFTIEEAPLDEAGRPRPFHVVVTIPAGAVPQAAVARLIVEGEKPAWVTAELRNGGT